LRRRIRRRFGIAFARASFLLAFPITPQALVAHFLALVVAGVLFALSFAPLAPRRASPRGLRFAQILPPLPLPRSALCVVHLALRVSQVLPPFPLPRRALRLQLLALRVSQLLPPGILPLLSLKSLCFFKCKPVQVCCA